MFVSIALAFSLQPLRFGYRKLRAYLAEDYETRLERFLGGKKKMKFALLDYRSHHSDLVERTRKILYGREKMTKAEYEKLLAEWKIAYAKNA